jgi:hypothetical protein
LLSGNETSFSEYKRTIAISGLQWRLLSSNRKCWLAIPNVGQQCKMQTRNARCRPEIPNADQQWQMLICNGECWSAIPNVGQQCKMQTINPEC